MNILPTAKKSGRSLKRRTNIFKLDLKSLSSFLYARFHLREFFQVIPDSRLVSGVFTSVIRGQTSDDELLRTNLDLVRGMPEVPTKSRQTAVISSNSFKQRAEIKRLCKQLDLAKADNHQFPDQLSITQDLLESNEEEFSPLSIDYIRLINGRKC